MVQSKVLSRLSRLDILLVTKPDEEGMELSRTLAHTKARVDRRWPCPEVVGVDCDILVCDFFPGIEKRYPWLPGEATAAVVMILPPSGNIVFDEVHAALPDALLYRPFRRDNVLAVLSAAWDSYSYHRRQSTRIAQLEYNVRSLRDVERAKTILMQERNISETKAFQALRQEAMEQRMQVSKLAKTIIDNRQH